MTSNTSPEPPVHLQKPRLRRVKAAEYLAICHGLPIAPATLAKLACLGGGPPFQRAGRVPLYPREELDAWAETRLGPVRLSTSDTDAATGEQYIGLHARL
jgi:hypothetical protein